MTSTLVFEEDGSLQEYAGGYKDWERRGKHLLETDTPSGEGYKSTALNTANEDERIRISQLVTQAISEEPRLEKELDTLFSFMFKRGQTMDAGGTSELMLQTRERAEEIQ